MRDVYLDLIREWRKTGSWCGKPFARKIVTVLLSLLCLMGDEKVWVFITKGRAELGDAIVF